jgi:hypothetical protein
MSRFCQGQNVLNLLDVHFFIELIFLQRLSSISFVLTQKKQKVKTQLSRSEIFPLEPFHKKLVKTRVFKRRALFGNGNQSKKSCSSLL